MKNDDEVTDYMCGGECGASEDYPLGGMIEPYDVQRDDEIVMATDPGTPDGDQSCTVIAARGHDGKLHVIAESSHVVCVRESKPTMPRLHERSKSKSPKSFLKSV